jgi:hypothetical protein
MRLTQSSGIVIVFGLLPILTWNLHCYCQLLTTTLDGDKTSLAFKQNRLDKAIANTSIDIHIKHIAFVKIIQNDTYG